MIKLGEKASKNATRVRSWGVLLLLATLTMGCAHTIFIDSAPQGSEVTMFNGEDSIKLGKTPLTFTPTESGALLFELGLPGYRSGKVFVPEVPGSMSFNIPLEKIQKEWLSSLLLEAQADLLDESLTDLLTLQSQILRKNKKQVAALIQKFEKKYDKVSIFHSLVGNYHYLNENFDEAIRSYKAALSRNSGNREAERMLKFLQDDLQDVGETPKGTDP